MNNIKRAEEAMRQEWLDSRNASADPFTRQACRPVLATKTKKKEGGSGDPAEVAPQRQDSIDAAEAAYKTQQEVTVS